MPVTVKRLSDNKVYKADVGPNDRVHELKSKLKAELAPQFPHGCRVLFHGKVLKSVHRLKHYGIVDNSELEMDDRKNWESSSSSSDSDRD